VAKISVDDRQFQKMLDNLEDIPEKTMKKVYPFYKEKTPVRSGNARNKTKLKDTTIKSDYGYAGRLDDGWSKQAPSGFTKPSEKKIDSIIDDYIKRI
tara:strand:+ start:1351 stop:1641 length:291 start_codon:yes stop_codon:yes gene_type:complete